MDIICVANQKGGAGKTTAAAHLAVAAHKAGASPVGIVDLDPQGSLTAWWNRRAANLRREWPILYQMSLRALAEQLEALRSDVKTLVIDTPPQRGDIIRAAIERATLIVIPLQPSALDVEAAEATLRVAQAAKCPAVALIALDDRTTLTRETREALSPVVPVLTRTVGHRKEAKVVMAHGFTGLDLEDVKSPLADDYRQVWIEISGISRKNM